MAIRGAAITGIDARIQDPIECHCSRTRRDHSHNDPKKSPAQSGNSKCGIAPRQKRAGQREWQRKHGVLELNHVKREPQACPETSHVTILGRRGRGAPDLVIYGHSAT